MGRAARDQSAFDPLAVIAVSDIAVMQNTAAVPRRVKASARF